MCGVFTNSYPLLMCADLLNSSIWFLSIEPFGCHKYWPGPNSSAVVNNFNSLPNFL